MLDRVNHLFSKKNSDVINSEPALAHHDSLEPMNLERDGLVPNDDVTHASLCALTLSQNGQRNLCWLIFNLSKLNAVDYRHIKIKKS